jgi:hypothetical protein
MSVGGALPAGTFFIRVRAVVDGVEGQASSEVILTSPSTNQAPAPPMTLHSSVSAGIVSLTWIAAPGNTESYVIEVGTASGQTNLGSFDAGVLDTNISAPVPPGTYYVRVRARNAFGSSGASNEVVVVVP